MIPTEKPSNYWKDLRFSAGTPLLLALFATLLLFSIGAHKPNYSEYYAVELVLIEGTEHTGSFALTEGRDVDNAQVQIECSSNGTHETCYYDKEVYPDGFSLMKATCEIENDDICEYMEVGYWHRSNETIIFDDGNSYNEPIIIHFETSNERSSSFENIIENISTAIFLLANLLSLVVIVVGLIRGRVGFTNGGIISLGLLQMWVLALDL